VLRTLYIRTPNLCVNRAGLATNAADAITAWHGIADAWSTIRAALFWTRSLLFWDGAGRCAMKHSVAVVNPGQDHDANVCANNSVNKRCLMSWMACARDSCTTEQPSRCVCETPDADREHVLTFMPSAFTGSSTSVTDTDDENVRDTQLADSAVPTSLQLVRVELQASSYMSDVNGIHAARIDSPPAVLSAWRGGAACHRRIGKHYGLC